MNVKRLIADAILVQVHGSAATAMSLAILAFEEAGKGHILELGIAKPRKLHSWHEFRHFMAFQLLGTSMCQKYGLDMSFTSGRLHAHLQVNTEALPKKKGMPARPPITDVLRHELHENLLKQFANMSASDKARFGVEIRWLTKIADLVDSGNLETIRQSGLYLDAEANSCVVTSSPMTITGVDAERWVWAATRVLNLLESGDFRQPYSPLSEALGTGDAIEAMNKLASDHGLGDAGS